MFDLITNLKYFLDLEEAIMFILFILLFSITLISIFFKYLFKYRNAKFSYISFLKLITCKIKQEGIKRIILTNLGRGLFLSFMLFVFLLLKIQYHSYQSH